MAISKLRLICFAASLVSANSRFLAPVQDINLPASETAEHPLEHLGANGPWYAGGDYVSQWNDVWIPPVLERLQALITGNLTLTENDVSQIPYLCGYESQITGRLSPWCDIFSDEEFLQYEYFQDLRYYYGVGPGTDIPSKMMTPYLNALMALFGEGPCVTGKRTDGSTFTLPKLIVSFLNDGQLNELVTASGVMDSQAPLSPTEKDDDRAWVSSRYTTMRGTIAFERLNCAVSGNGTYGNATHTSPPVKRCSNSTAPSPPSGSHNATYVRIRLNDAVYPLPSCKNGPGSSCLLEDYRKYVSNKLDSEGNWITNCNVTAAGAPSTVKGASFYTDLTSPWLSHVAP
ncbi:hypothetical protein Brms1b_010072 [Colletotrichum noveboracense]|nr:hypothetical protein Brms1b_010072 [Colletotrichum noveboracense]